jgi:hypothetical protein
MFNDVGVIYKERKQTRHEKANRTTKYAKMKSCDKKTA